MIGEKLAAMVAWHSFENRMLIKRGCTCQVHSCSIKKAAGEAAF